MMDGNSPMAETTNKDAEEILVTTSMTRNGDDSPRENYQNENNNDNNNNGKMLVGSFSKLPEILVHICTK